VRSADRNKAERLMPILKPLKITVQGWVGAFMEPLVRFQGRNAVRGETPHYTLSAPCKGWQPITSGL